MEKISSENLRETKDMQDLANELEVIMAQRREKGGPMQKLIDRLRKGSKEDAIACVRNEIFDKITDYEKDALPIIVEKLFDGSGSPWKNLEKRK